jgi:hypothetical protein
MSEIMVNLKGTELGDRLNIDMISIESLVSEFEDTLYQMDMLQNELSELKKSDDEKYDDYIWYKVDEQYEKEKLGEI